MIIINTIYSPTGEQMLFIMRTAFANLMPCAFEQYNDAMTQRRAVCAVLVSENEIIMPPLAIAQLCLPSIETWVSRDRIALHCTHCFALLCIALRALRQKRVKNCTF